jgi:hypothetical protein
MTSWAAGNLTLQFEHGSTLEASADPAAIAVQEE